MPLHDWSRVPAGLFHDFRQTWAVQIKLALNAGILPRGLSALVEQRSGPRESNRIVVKHRLGRAIAVIEIVSPGNKDSRAALRDFVEKVIDSLRSGIHVVVIDLFPPTPRDPSGIHKAIRDEIEEEGFAFPEGKDRILASYETGETRAYYVEPIGVGDALPDMPLFLTDGWQVPLPLESTHRTTWDASSEDYRAAVETGLMPGPDAG